MKTILILTAVLAATAGAAHADDDDWCRNVPKEKRLAVEAVAEKAKAMGVTVRKIEMDDGCYEVHAFGAGGDRFKLYLDPENANLLRVDED